MKAIGAVRRPAPSSTKPMRALACVLAVFDGAAFPWQTPGTRLAAKRWRSNASEAWARRAARTSCGAGGRYAARGEGLTMTKRGFGGMSKATKFKFTGTTRPGTLSPTREVPAHVRKPDYAETGKPAVQPPRFSWMIDVKTDEQIAGMRAACRAAREVLDTAGRAVAAGVTTDEIDRIVHEETVKRGGYPSPLNYHGFPKSCCTSLNEIICHGIPDSTKLREGDILNIDVTVFLNGFHGDCSEMFCVGEVDDRAKNLLQVTYDAWQAAAGFCEPGKPYKDIGAVIEEYVTARGFTTVKNFCGHGIGEIFHTNPNILHYRNNEPAGVMKPGHTFTIEPMICEGSSNSVVWPDAWTAATVDGKRTAQFEHTFLMTENGLEALTAKTADSPRQFWEPQDGRKSF